MQWQGQMRPCQWRCCYQPAAAGAQLLQHRAKKWASKASSYAREEQRKQLDLYTKRQRRRVGKLRVQQWADNVESWLSGSSPVAEQRRGGRSRHWSIRASSQRSEPDYQPQSRDRRQHPGWERASAHPHWGHHGTAFSAQYAHFASAWWDSERVFFEQLSREQAERPAGQQASWEEGYRRRQSRQPGQQQQQAASAASQAQAHRAVLGLEASGPLDAVTLRKAFLKAVKVWHPDVHPGCSKALAEQTFKQVKEAYENLRLQA